MAARSQGSQRVEAHSDRPWQSRGQRCAPPPRRLESERPPPRARRVSIRPAGPNGRLVDWSLLEGRRPQRRPLPAALAPR